MDQPEVVSGLLARGFDPNSPSPQGVPALLLCYQKKSNKVLEVLLSSKQTNLNVLNSNGENLLMLASINNQLPLVEKLIEKGADINKPGWTALHYAASKGHNEVIKALLEQQAYIDAESPNGTTPLMMAARYASPKTVKLLLEEGADPRIRNQLGYDALQMAQKQSSLEAESYISAFLADWRERYENPNRQTFIVIEAEDSQTTGAEPASDGTDMQATQSIADAPQDKQAIEDAPQDRQSVEDVPQEMPTHAQEDTEEPLVEVLTGGPLHQPLIETGEVLPGGQPGVIEIRPAEIPVQDIAVEPTKQAFEPIQVETISVPAGGVRPYVIPYTKQIRAKNVVNIDLVGGEPAVPEDAVTGNQ